MQTDNCLYLSAVYNNYAEDEYRYGNVCSIVTYDRVPAQPKTVVENKYQNI